MPQTSIITYSNEKPPVLARCEEMFNVSWNRGVIITYGDTVHCKFEIPDHLKVHEGVHVRQQTAMGKEIWWDRYFKDPLFRLSQEIEAYREQIAFAEKTMNREARRELRKHIIYDMVHSYGKMCTKEQAIGHLYGPDEITRY